MKRIKRVLALILCGAMLVGNLPTPVFAEDLFQQGLCEHHLAHDNCGYQDTIIGADCSHEHTEECYTQAHSCVHQHGDCSYVESSDEITCDHQCTAENGCISIQLACCHSHDDQCGYAEPQESSPCTYVCEECIQQDSPVCTGALDCPVNEHDDGCEKKAADEKAAEDQAAADAVAALIDALPALEVIQAKEQLDQQEDYNQIQTAYDAYESLTEDQKALLPDSEEMFSIYFEYFNTLTMETDTSEGSGSCGENLIWVFDAATGKLTISGSGKMDDYIYSGSSVNTPWFGHKDQLRIVEITPGVTSIGECAFANCDNIISVFIPDSVTYIKWGAFLECSSLINAQIGSGVTDIDGFAFGNCTSLESILIGDNVKIIHEAAFNECTALTNITLPDGLEELWEQAFYGCSLIESIDIPSSVHTIGRNAFFGCISLNVINYNGTKSQWYTIADQTNWAENNNFSINYLAEEVLEYTLNADGESYSVAGIGTCYDIIAIHKTHEGLPVTRIREQAFEGCTSLESIIIPDNITYIEWGAFLECASLTSAQIGNGVTDIDGFAFGNCTSLESILIGDNVKIIHEAAFNECVALTSITLPKNLEEIWEQAFYGCTGLSEITFEYDAPSIRTNAFYNVTATAYYPANNPTWTEEVMQNYGGNITWVAYGEEHVHEYDADHKCECGAIGGSCGENLTWEFDTATNTLTISGSGSMNNFTDSYPGAPWYNYREQIKNVNIQFGATNIGGSAFINCTALEYVSIPNSVTCIEDNTFNRCDSLANITIPDSVISIDDGAFYHCVSLNTITLPNSITQLDSAFESCSNLSSVTLPNSIKYIAESTFAHCTGLTSITIPDSVSDIGRWAFYNCSSLNSISIPENVTCINDYVFYDCSSLRRIEISQNIINIGNYAFRGCTNLTSISFEGNVPTIMNNSFNDVTATVYYPTNNPTWTEEVMQDYGGNLTWVGFDGDSTYSGICGDDQTWVFDKETGKLSVYGTGEMYGADKLNWTVFTDEILSVVIKSGVTSIGAYAFNDCIKLADIEIADTVMDIAYNAFESCSSLKTIDIPENVMEITYGTFMDCTSLSTVTLPQNLRSIGDHAFDNCSSLSTMKLPQNLRNIGDHAFGYCVNLTEVEFPASLVSVRSDAFKNCTILKQIRFNGNAPEIQNNAFYNVQANAYYPVGNRTWISDVMLNYGGTLTWMEYGAVENRVTIDSADLAGQASVWIDGVEYAVQRSGNSCYVDLPDSNARTMVVHTYNSSSSNRYPVSMKVWILENEDGIYTATHAEIFDDILQYSGMSIRVTGKKGIRMVTSIEKEKKNALVSGGLSGYTLKEYGTVVAWASKLADGNPLTLGQSYAMSNYAYKKGVADPVFAYNGSLMQYTNVLVNFTDEQCKYDLALRPYMILEDAEGEEMTLYGGIVNRSIGYIAYQNRNEFEPGTEEYNYIWDIIHYVYGDVYDDEFEQAWTPPKV